MNPGDFVQLLPWSGFREQPAPEGRFKRLAARMAGRWRVEFPILGLDPAALDGVLCLGEGEPGDVFVNAARATPRRQGRFGWLLDASLFYPQENVVACRPSAWGLTLRPVTRRNRLAGLPLPPGARWRVADLEGAPLGELEGPALPASVDDDRVRLLARGLGRFIRPDGDAWSFYDLRDQGYRLADWRWDTGIVLEALALAAQTLNDSRLLDQAQVVGKRLAALALTDQACPGGVPERADTRFSETTQGAGQWVVPFNMAFVACGLVRLARASANQGFAHAAEAMMRLGAWRGLTEYGGVAGYYFPKSGAWRYVGQINDSSVFPRGLAMLGESRRQDWPAATAARAAAFVLSRAARPDGHIGRAWWSPQGAAPAGEPLYPEWKRHPDRVVPRVFLRGQAWALMGFSGAMALGAGQAVRDAAARLRDYVLQAQQDDGSWLYSQNQPELGACVKGTAALALALTEHARTASEPVPRRAVEKALHFLEARSWNDTADVPAELVGLPVEFPEEGCIITHRGRRVVCAYAAALELMTRLALREMAS